MLQIIVIVGGCSGRDYNNLNLKSNLFPGLPPAFNSTRRNAMALQINDVAPDFEADTTEGHIRFHEWIGDSWCVMFSHPKDFTPVCTTELGYMARLKPEFDKRNTKIIGLSVDPVENHKKWANDIRETQGQAPNYPMTTGRNFDEVLRVIDSLQLTATHKVATPVNWKPGEDVIIAGSVSDDDAKKTYPDGWKAPRPYIRIVPQPKS